MSLPSPKMTGYAPVYSVSNSAFSGMTKGTLFWLCGAGSLASSSDGFTWTERLSTALTGAGVTGYTSVVVGCPIAIGDIMVCHLQVSGGASAGLWFLRYDGSAWTKADASGYVTYGAGEFNLPLAKANGLFFILGTDGLYSSTDGSVWTQRIDLTDEEPGGPNYSMRDIIYQGSTYYAIARVTYPLGGETVFRYTSSNLTDWTSYTTALPSGTTYGIINRIFAGASEFYLDGTYYLLKSSDFITWSAVLSSPGFGLSNHYYNLDAGFLVDYQGLYTAYLPYSKSDLALLDYEVLVDSEIVGGPIQDEVIVSGGYVHGCSATDKWTFKYDDTWDNGSAAPDRSGVLSATSGLDTATFAGTVQIYINTISGTLRLDTSDGAFAARKVYLYSYTTGLLMDETTSDAITGVWEFTAVASGDYFVVGAATSDDYVTFNRDFDALGVITVV